MSIVVRFALNPVCAEKNSKGGWGVSTSNDFVSTLNILKIERSDPFVALKNCPRNVISGIHFIEIRYIRFALNPLWILLWGLIYSSKVVCTWPKVCTLPELK